MNSIEILNKSLNAAGIPTKIENLGGDIMGCVIILYDGEHIIVDDEDGSSAYWHTVQAPDFEMVESNHGFSIAEIEQRLRKSL